MEDAISSAVVNQLASLGVGWISVKLEDKTSRLALEDTIRRYLVNEKGELAITDQRRFEFASLIFNVTPLAGEQRADRGDCFLEVVDPSRPGNDPQRVQTFFLHSKSGRLKRARHR